VPARHDNKSVNAWGLSIAFKKKNPKTGENRNFSQMFSKPVSRSSSIKSPNHGQQITRMSQSQRRDSGRKGLLASYDKRATPAKGTLLLAFFMKGLSCRVQYTFGRLGNRFRADHIKCMINKLTHENGRSGTVCLGAGR